MTLLSEQGIESIVADTQIDQHLLPQIEMHSSGEYKFSRVDSEISQHLLDDSKTEIVDANNKSITDKIKGVFERL